MSKFKYSGRSKQGQVLTGEMEAATVDAVASALIGRGITPVKIEPFSAASSYMRQLNSALGGDKVGTNDLIMFCRQMYTITKSGIPLTRGIRGLGASIRHEHFRDVLGDVAERLEAGVGLSQAMRHHPKVFNSLFVSMVAVGETSGNLDEIFRQIGFYLERDEETRKRIKQATRYPMFVSIAIVLAMAAVNIWVVPAFADMFAKFDADLPIVTRILIFTSNAFVNYWLLMLVAVVGMVGGAYYYLNTPEGALQWGKKRLKMPLVGELIERATMARYARSFGLMLRAGVPVNKALALCAAAIDNPYIAAKIQQIRQSIERGESLLRTHLQAEMFTPLVLQMIAVGEESGQVEALLTEVAEFYEREVDYDLKTLTDRIEPILIIVMAAFVALLAVGIFLPMWSMYEVQA